MGAVGTKRAQRKQLTEAGFDVHGALLVLTPTLPTVPLA